MQTNPIAIKTALNLLGHEVGGFRLPLVEADEAEGDAVRGLPRAARAAPAAAASGARHVGLTVVTARPAPTQPSDPPVHWPTMTNHP